MRVAASVLAIFLASQSLACDYPGPPPMSSDARAETGDIRWAGFSNATKRYGRGILGDAIEAGALRAATLTAGPCDLTVLLGEGSVFEDVAPRIQDLDGDGKNEIVVVETRIDRGASLAVYGIRRGALVKLAATPYIGTQHRWLAPIGAADLDGDGRAELAYVDRPHLAKTIRIWRYENGGLTHMADLAGYTNHRIGESSIVGGIRDCGQGPEMIVADAGWDGIYAIGWNGRAFSQRRLGPHTGRQSFAAALDCQQF